MPHTQLSVNKGSPPAASFCIVRVARVPSIIGMFFKNLGERSERVIRIFIQGVLDINVGVQVAPSQSMSFLWLGGLCFSVALFRSSTVCVTELKPVQLGS